MLSQSKIKLIRSLRLSKFRNIHGLFAAEGDKMVREALQLQSIKPFRIVNIYALGEWVEYYQELTSPYRDLIEIVSQRELGQISSLKTPNQALALIKMPEESKSLPRPDKNLVIALDNIQDPGNIGTIIRLADWFSVNEIALSSGCADTFSPKVVQASMGSIFRVRTYQIELDKWVKGLGDTIPVYGTLLEGKSIYKSDLSERRGVLLFGNESKGISGELGKLVRQPITIPRGMSETAVPDSLNVAIAAAIVLSEFNRQSS